MNELRNFISFDAIKHHHKYVLNIIEDSKKKNLETDQIIFKIKSIPNNILDLYIGALDAQTILSQIFLQLESNNILNKKDYEIWIFKTGYKLLKLSDNSYWVLRLGKNDEKFIHLHPAHKGEQSIRLKGSAWKTAVMTAIKLDLNSKHINLLNKVNFTRTQYLGLSPIKEIISGSSLYLSLRLMGLK